MRSVDILIVYRIIKILATPWVDQDAYRLGIIDAHGNVLKKARQLNTSQERDAYSILHRFVFNLKRLIEKVPGGPSKIGTYTAALYLLLREDMEIDELFEMQMLEDAPVNNVGGGHIAGLGVGPGGEPPMPKKRKKTKRFINGK